MNLPATLPRCVCKLRSCNLDGSYYESLINFADFNLVTVSTIPATAL